LWSCLLGSDTLTKSLCRRTQSQLGIDVRQARFVDERKQTLADRVEGLLIRAVGVRRLVAAWGCRPRSALTGLSFGCVSTAVGSSRRSILTWRPRRGMQSRRGCPALQLACVQQRREILRHLAEYAPLATWFVRLDRVPVTQHLAGVGHFCVREHVWMATDQLLAAVLCHLREIARTTLLEQQREKHNLEEHVPQLVEQLGVIAAMRGIGQLIGLLDRVRHDRALVLLAIPRALAAQQMRQLIERE
jgi:hypothetical protein